MKKHIQFLGFFLIAFVFQLSAQTIKNIYRQNQPVLRIPTHLVDRVETSEILGSPHLRVIQFNGYVSEIPLAQIDSITHSEGQAVDPAQFGNLRYTSVMGVVSGPTGSPEMNAIVRSPFGGEETITDANGVFFLDSILVYENLGYITITKPDFHQSSRSFLPLETGVNRVNAKLLRMQLSGSFNASSGGAINTGLLHLSFPPNAVLLNGEPFTGTVRVYASALDPTSSSMFDQMPGELLGGMNDSLRLLRSFGMASVQLRDNNMNELQLATGVNATLTFNIPSALQAEAPQSIDWWSFDEGQGIWMHEGVAQKQGEQYVGLASHFSWWNFDVPMNFNNLSGTVNAVGGNPISDAQVNVVSPTWGSGVTYSNADGHFSIRVPQNQSLILNVNLTCSTTNDWALAHTETIISATEALSSSIIAGLEGRYPITGIVLNCDGQPIENGYVKMGSMITFTHDGEFSIQACQTGNFSLRGFNTSNPDTIKVSELQNFLLGVNGTDLLPFQACNLTQGFLNDIDGNTYGTVLIGNQFWMTENLKTTRFRNGAVIPNVQNNFWSQTTTPAWCNYENNSSNDSLYGKLYNWYNVQSANGICPSGWHVPSRMEFQELTTHLGGNGEAFDRLIAETGWNIVVTEKTNDSGFSALPGGYKNNTDGFSPGSFPGGRWWTNTLYDLNNSWAWYFLLGSNISGQSTLDYQWGHSIRCVQD